MISLEMLLRMPGLREVKLIAGRRGLDKEVKAVSVIDAPDSYKWLKGNELILTSGFLVGGDSGLLEHFVLNLIEAGSIGLGIKKERFIKRIPENVVRAAEKHGFPILEIPYHFVWSDIFSVFYELLFSIAEKPFVPIEPDHVEKLTNAARYGASSLTDELTRVFQVPVAIILNNKKITDDNGMPGVKLIAGALEDSPFFPENIGDEILTAGKYFITVCPVPFKRRDRAQYLAIMSQSGLFLKEIQKLFRTFANMGEQENTAYNDRGRVYRKFMLGFMAGQITIGDIKSLEEYRGAHERLYTGVMLIESDDVNAVYRQAEEVLKTARLTKRGRVVGHIVDNAAKNEAVVMLELYLNDKDESPEIWQYILIEDLEYFLRETQIGRVSVGRMRQKLDDVTESYHEAREALEVGRALWEERRCFTYSMVSVYSILRKANLSQFDLYFMQLLENSKSGFYFDCIQTLEAYIERGGYKKAAADLYIHENTLRYRVQKISDLLHQDIEDPMIVNLLLIQIKLWKLMKLGYITDDHSNRALSV